MEPTTLETWILGLLKHLNREKLTDISQLLEPISLIPLSALKEIKSKVLNLATSNPDLFFEAAAIYYAKFIQSIKLTNLVSECGLIPQYLKTIEIMKNLSNGEARGFVENFEYYLRIIIDGVNENLLYFGSIEKTLEYLNILKEIDEKFKVKYQKEDYEFLDPVMQEYVDNEPDLKKSYIIITKIKEGWDFDLFLSEGSWIAKARQRLEEEDKENCDKNYVKEILIILRTFENEYYPEIKVEIIHLCEGFAIDSNEIFSSEPPKHQDFEFLIKASTLSSEFSPIFENPLINRKSQFKLKKRPISLQQNSSHIAVWQGYCLLNLQHICVKEYKGNDPRTLNQYNKEANIIQNLSEIGSTLYLKHFSNFDEGDSHFIVMEYCKQDLKELIYDKKKFSREKLAYFAYSFIKGLSELKIEANLYHRDIKPANIMIGYDNEFKLIDFNISVNVEIDSLRLGIRENTIVGTPEYYSPEKYKCPKIENQNRFEHSRELNDVYSLGLVILEMHTHEIIVSFRKLGEEIFFNKMAEQFSQITIPWLSNLLDKMLTYDWNRRPRFGELLEMIEQDEEFMKDVKNCIITKKK